MNYFSYPSTSIQEVKPTTGISYNYVRQTDLKTTLYNLYEIGGGLSSINLVKTILNENSLKNTVFVVCLDLSKPELALNSMKNFLANLKKVVLEVVNNNEILNYIKKLKNERLNQENQSDLKRINPFPVEVVIVGTKYDYFETLQIDNIKWVCKCLRFFSHFNTTGLVTIRRPSADDHHKQIKNVIIYFISR
jgi:dynein light intermediate chain 2